jgi:nitrate/nitrite-specific signal transduction histidine kinase
LRQKVVAGLLLSTMLPITLFWTGAAYLRYLDAIENAESILEERALVSSLLVNNKLDTVLHDLATTGQTSLYADALSVGIDAAVEANEELSTTRLATAMTELMDNNPEYRAIRFLDPEGNLLRVQGNVAEIPIISATRQRQSNAFQQIIDHQNNSENHFLLDPYPDPESGQPIFEGVNLLVQNNTLLGYLIFTLDTDAILFNPLNEITTQTTPEQSLLSDVYMYVVDAEGWLLTPTLGSEPFTVQMPLEHTTLDAEGGEETQQTYIRDWRDNAEPIEVAGRHAEIGNTGWYIITEINMEDVREPIFVDQLTTGIPVAMLVIGLVVMMIVLINVFMITPMNRITQAAQHISAGRLDAPLPVIAQRDEIGTLANAVSSMTSQMRAAIEELETRVADRTRDLAISSQLGREASALQDINHLLNNLVNQIVNQFPEIYHAQVFLNDKRGEYAVLTASTGEPGRELLNRGHRLGVGSVSVIGRVTGLGETVIARDTSSSRFHKQNEFLPETRAEMAIPLIYDGQVLGALDVQSKQPEAFTTDWQTIAETLAAQLAIAIHNNQLFAELNQRVEEAETLNRQLTRQSWQQTLSGSARQGTLQAVAGQAAETGRDEWSVWQHRAAQLKEIVVSPPDEAGISTLAVPIITRDEVLGVVEWHIPANRLNAQVQRLAADLTNRLTATLETLRLLERTERLAQRERLVNKISGRLTAEPNVALILDTAVQELSDVLQTPHITIQLARPNHTAAEPDRMENA